MRKSALLTHNKNTASQFVANPLELRSGSVDVAPMIGVELLTETLGLALLFIDLVEAYPFGIHLKGPAITVVEAAVGECGALSRPGGLPEGSVLHLLSHPPTPIGVQPDEIDETRSSNWVPDVREVILGTFFLTFWLIMLLHTLVQAVRLVLYVGPGPFVIDSDGVQLTDLTTQVD